jgi:hypothetical protein
VLLTIGIQITESTLLARCRGQHPEQHAPDYWILYHYFPILTSEANYITTVRRVVEIPQMQGRDLEIPRLRCLVTQQQSNELWTIHPNTFILSLLICHSPSQSMIKTFGEIAILFTSLLLLPLIQYDTDTPKQTLR